MIYLRIEQKNRLIRNESVRKRGTQKETQPKNCEINQSSPISLKTTKACQLSWSSRKWPIIKTSWFTSERKGKSHACSPC